MQRLASPGLVPTSQEAGGMVHDNALAHTAPGSPPGCDAGRLTYPVSEDMPAPDMFGGDTVPVSTQAGHGGNPAVPAEGGRFTVPADGDAGKWGRAGT